MGQGYTMGWKNGRDLQMPSPRSPQSLAVPPEYLCSLAQCGQHKLMRFVGSIAPARTGRVCFTICSIFARAVQCCNPIEEIAGIGYRNPRRSQDTAD